MVELNQTLTSCLGCHPSPGASSSFFFPKTQWKEFILALKNIRLVLATFDIGGPPRIKRLSSRWAYNFESQ